MSQLIKPSLVNCDYEEKYEKIFKENSRFQSPWMIIKFLAGLIYNVFVYLFLLKDPTDEDIVEYVENSTLALLLNSDAEESTLEVEDCNLESCLPSVAINSINMVFKKHPQGKASIESFHLNGEKITNRSLMTEALFFYHTASVHPKFHLYSNSLTEYIVDNNISTLKPSTKTSLPLHNALTRSDKSPAPDLKVRTERPWMYRFFTRVYSVEITRESLIEETLSPPPFKNLSQEITERSVPFVRYLAECKEAVRNALCNADLPAELLDPLFCHIIVHAVDHSSCYTHTRNLKFGVGEFLREPCSGFSLFRSLMFRWQMVKPSHHPILSNKLKGIQQNPFYSEIYESVKTLDVKYGLKFADIITASTMY